MNKKFKSFLSLVLAVTMLVSTLTVTPVMAAGYSNDTNAPVLTISPAPATGNNLTSVSAGSTITVSAQNASQITYWWDSDKAQTRSGSQISINVPNGTGKHRLNLEASNGSSSTGWRNYDYQVVSGGYNTNNVTLSPAPGAVARGTSIRINGGYNLTYGWEYENQTTGNGSLNYSGVGVKKLLVNNNGQTYTYTYYFTEDTTAPRNLNVSQTSNVAASKTAPSDPSIATITVTGGASTIRYNCTFAYTIATTNNTPTNAAAALTALQKDGTLTLSADSGITLSTTSFALGAAGSGTGSFTKTGPGSADIDLAITFKNTNVSQNDLANSSFVTTVTINNFDCDIA